MGCDYTVACMTCKEITNLGYGSATTWLIFCDSVEAFDMQPESAKSLAKNQAWRRFLLKHEGHSIECWNGDYTQVESGFVTFDDNIGGEPVDVRGFLWITPAEPDQPKSNHHKGIIRRIPPGRFMIDVREDPVDKQLRWFTPVLKT